MKYPIPDANIPIIIAMIFIDGLRKTPVMAIISISPIPNVSLTIRLKISIKPLTTTALNIIEVRENGPIASR